MEDLAVKISEGSKLVYLLQGSEEMKTSLMKAVEECAGGTVSISDEFIIPSEGEESEFYPNNSENAFLDLITVRILMADYLFVHVPTSNKVSGSRIKELVHGDFFSLYYFLIGGQEKQVKERKLIIFSTAGYNGSIFQSEAALKARCKFL